MNDPDRRRRVLAAATIAALALPAAIACDGTTTVVAPDDMTRTAPPGGATDATPAPPSQTMPSTPATTGQSPVSSGPRVPDDTGGVLIERPAGFPNRGEAFILARLHPEVARRCTRAERDTIAAGAVAGLRCDTEPALGVAAFYDLFPTAVAAAGAYGRYRRANDVPLGRGNCLATGPPSARLPAEGPWRAGRGVGTGRAMCFRAGERVWLVSAHPARINAYLSASARAPLAPFWRTMGAPTARPR